VKLTTQLHPVPKSRMLELYLHSPICLHGIGKRKDKAMKTYGGVDVQIHIFFTSVIVGGEWSASRLGRATPEERAPGTHWIGGWVGPIDGLEDVEKILDPNGTRTPIPRSFTPQPVAIPTELPRLPSWHSYIY
jgi:hypothetical protein